MCGINGFLSSNYSKEQKKEIVQKMNYDLAHRGPDNDGVWEDDLITLGHRRLKILDLSESANQPFFSNDKRYVIVYNGELYNFKELKLELQRAPFGSNYAPYFFNTNSDTEVILAAFIRYGSKCLNLFNGMYAFAIYDTVEKKLFIARDRLGVKPLYYHYGDKGLMFSSEIKPILKSNINTFCLNKDVLAEYIMYQTVYAPNTIVKGIKMLMPGHYLEYKDNQANLYQYYSVNKISTDQNNLSYKESCHKINELLTLSVQQRLVSDVPFGAFLSGGIDSSALVAIMSKISSDKIQTFNISFDESEFSESVYAKQIATKFNTQHHEIKLTPNDFLKQLPDALNAMDYPTGDGINTYIVSKATKNAGITMALSGIGGDEIFAGYDVFKRLSDLQKKSWLNTIPLLSRKAAGYIVRKKNKSVKGNKIEELLNLPNINFNSAYPLSRSVFTQKELSKIIKSENAFREINQIISEVPQIKNHLLSAVSLSEINTYLQNVLLRDTDQMSMAVALEIREPFLDYKLIDFVLSVDDEKKYPHTPKKLLVDSLGDLLPESIINRKKMGFVLPWKLWLKNELRSFCEKNITEFCEYDFCNKTEIENLWQRFLNNDETITWSRIWHLVVLNYWIKETKIAV